MPPKLIAVPLPPLIVPESTMVPPATSWIPHPVVPMIVPELVTVP